jgi:parallel beta-helix repeat protein
LKKNLIYSIILVLSLLSFYSFVQYIFTNKLSNDTIPKSDVIPLGSESFDLTGSPIYIDDLDPEKNWNETVKNEWCSGNGTKSNPYILSNITINGQGSSDCIYIKNSRKFFKIQNCTLSNEPYSHSGIKLTNVTNGYIVKNNFLDGLYGILLNNSNHNRIENNSANEVYTGIKLIKSNYSTIRDNTLLREHGKGIWLDQCKNNTIHSNVVKYSEHDGIYTKYSTHIKIISNIVIESDFSGINLDYCDQNLVKGNFINKTFWNYGGRGIGLYYSNNNRIFNNTCIDNQYGITSDGNFNQVHENKLLYNRYNGIFIYGLGNSILANRIEKTGTKEFSAGISLQYGDNNTLIEKNQLLSNNNGIFMEGTTNCSVKDNFIFNNTNGINLILSNYDNKFENNLITNNSQYGIVSDAYFPTHPNLKNKFIDNKIKYNGKAGLLFNRTYGNIIRNNFIRGNTFNGTVFLNAHNNTISLNKFLDNSQNAFDNGLNNSWSENGMGNYWSDYKNYDYNKDGIGDFPYNISGTAKNKDYHPLGYFIPLIDINLPYSNKVYNEDPPEFFISINNLNTTHIWYTIDHGKTNFTINTNFGYVDYQAWQSASEGPITLKFYAKDVFGNVGSNKTQLYKKIPKSLYLNILQQIYTENYFNITFQVLDNGGISVIDADVDLWWNKTLVTNELIYQGNGIYLISLLPILITSEDDPIPLEFLLTKENYTHYSSIIYIAIDPEAVSKLDSEGEKNQDPAWEIIIPIATVSSIGVGAAILSAIYLSKRKT